MRAPATPVCAVAMLVLGATGCGGGGGDDSSASVRKVVAEFAAAVNQRDGAKLCGELTTRAYVERTTAATGDAAITKCEAQIALLPRGGKYRVARFVSTRIDGDKATVVADLQAAGETRRTTLRLAKQDGSFRLTSGTGR